MSRPPDPDSLRRLQELAFLLGSPDAQAVVELRQRIETDTPALAPVAAALIAAGLHQRETLTTLYRIAAMQGADHPSTRDALAALASLSPEGQRLGEEVLAAGLADFNAGEEEAERLAEGRPLTDLEGRGEHRLPRLPAAPVWTLAAAGPTPRQLATRGAGRPGARWVAVLVPAGVELPDIDPDDNVDVALGRVLALPVGILGLTVGLEGLVHRKRAGLNPLVFWAQRLLQLDRPTRLDVLVTESVDEPADEAHPRRGKPDGPALTVTHFGVPPNHPAFRAARLIAHVWNRDRLSDRVRLERARLRHTCLHEGGASRLGSAWDGVATGLPPDGPTWGQILGDPASEHPGSIPALLLDKLASLCRKRSELWKRYLDRMLEECMVRYPRYERVARSVRWLDMSRPEELRLPGELVLGWQVARIMAANRSGLVDEALLAECRRQSDALLDEDARLVCLADVQRAELQVSHFAFDQAAAELTRWEALPVAVPGRQLWARVQAMRGHLLAFRGHYAEAARPLEAARAAYELLTNAERVEYEVSRLLVFRAFVALDDPDCPPDEARRWVLQRISLDEDAIIDLAGDADSETVLDQRLLVRYLLYRGTRAEQAAYLRARARWAELEGLSWQLLRMYRALLLDCHGERPAAVHWLMPLRHQASQRNAGPVPRFLGAVAGIILAGWGRSWPEGPECLREVGKALPHARDRIETLRSELEAAEKTPPAELLPEVLPYHFH
jgi:hypothetical protein